MAGEKLIPYDYIDLDFWNAWPRKFNSKAKFQKKMVT